MGKRIERAIREITEDVKEMGKDLRGWTVTIGVISFLLTAGWWIMG